MASVTLSMKGIPNVVKALQALEQKAPESYRAALYQEGELLRGEAQALTPVLTGVLKASAFVNEPVATEAGASVTVGFGGAAEAYAVRQHEDTTFKHRVGQAKYLEQPFLQRAKNLAANIAAKLKRDLGT